MTDLRQLAEQVVQLRDAVDYLTAVLEPDLTSVPNPGAANTAPPRPRLVPATGPRPYTAHVWHTLTATEAAAAWTALTRWVDWLIDRYRLDEAIPDCWYRHGAIVDELDALRAAWTAAYLDPQARPVDASIWHELFDHLLIRIRTWDRYGCAAGTHRDDITTATDSTSHGGREDYQRDDIDVRARAQRLHVVATAGSPTEIRHAGTIVGTPTRCPAPVISGGPDGGAGQEA